MQHKNTTIKLSSQFSEQVHSLLFSMLQINPDFRPDINQVLENPIFNKFKQPPFYFPLTMSEYNYMLDCYLLNTKGADYLHLTEELMKLKTISTDTTKEEKINSKHELTSDGSTQRGSTFQSEIFQTTYPDDEIFSRHESLSEFLTEPNFDDLTVVDFRTVDDQSKFESLPKDSMMLQTIYDYSNDLNYWHEEFSCGNIHGFQPLNLNMPEFTCETKPVLINTDPQTTEYGLNPRIISIKRKLSEMMDSEKSSHYQ